MQYAYYAHTFPIFLAMNVIVGQSVQSTNQTEIKSKW